MDAASRMMYAIVERSPLLVVAVQSGHRGEVVVVVVVGGLMKVISISVEIR